MSQQHELGFAPRFEPPAEPESNRGLTDVGERFAAFHQANPQVFDRLRALALGARRRGVEHWSVKGLFEVLRWQSAIETKGEAWLLNNTYTAHYARLLMEQVPELSGFFETRRSMAGAGSSSTGEQ